ncbi:hypothetical protein TNCV_4414781 [Trichonephila clavipes]|uniref:Uncharacterized protein n=1 Tax=Trichonephila clavipes TaxID=2585209 RepID=A0A8X6S4E0_TRICX|nr:hypothetical protein TNCV_4414781 [Trichonephila clavipes]
MNGRVWVVSMRGHYRMYPAGKIGSCAAENISRRHHKNEDVFFSEMSQNVPKAFSSSLHLERKWSSLSSLLRNKNRQIGGKGHNVENSSTTVRLSTHSGIRMKAYV